MTCQDVAGEMEPEAATGDEAAGALFYHGGNLSVARGVFPGAPAPWIDLSTGINPTAYPLGEIPATDWTRLPDSAGADELASVAATAYGVDDPACVVAAPGTQALLQWLPRIVPARRVAILGFTYAEHARCWSAAGAVVSEETDLGALAAADVAVVVNPNNPDGRTVAAADLLALARRMAATGRTLVVDEAFVDVMPAEASVAAAVSRTDNLVVLRSFGKTYGLPGLRLGFACTGSRRAERLRTALGPWAVGGPALTVGRRALADHGWLAATRARLSADAGRLAGMLAGAGLSVVAGTPLYLLVEDPGAHATFRRLGERGVLVRAFERRPSWLRVGLPGEQDWDVLQARLDSL